MSFSFGNTSGSAFGSTPTKPTGFGTPLAFGTPTTTTASTGFSFGTPTFGTAQPQQSTFGSAQPQQNTFGTAQPQQSTFGSAQPQQSTFGSAQPQQSTFGAAQPQQSTFGSSFGTPAATAPAFGSTSFGQPTATVAPTFGSAFGTATTSSAAPAFGSSFGPATSSAGTGGLFGQTTKPSLFGTQTAGGLFSTPASTATGSLWSTPTQSTGGGLFGGQSTGGGGLFGTTTTTTSAPLFGGFGGTTATTSAPSLFGSSTPGLGLGTGGLFGSTPATTQSLFGGFGTTTTTASGFGGFGGFGTTTTSTAGGLFGSTFGAKPAATIQQTAPQDPTQVAVASIYAINVFGDERDEVLKKWNMLQACWGTGKGYYSQNQPPVEYNHCNPFYRFKAIGYMVIPERENSEGLVKLCFNKKESEMSGQKQVLVNGIGGILGNRPNLTVTVELIKAVSDTQTEVMITVTEKGATGINKKIPALELAAFFNQPMQKQQLTNVGVTCVIPYVTPTKDQVEEYLKNPPPGIDLQMWQAAQMDNPNPRQYLPTPINGFSELKKRMLTEEYETGLHRAYLQKVDKEIVELKKKHAASGARIAEQKEKFVQLQHRLLKILVKQEITRKIGMSLQPEEEKLRERLEMMNAVIESPNQLKGQLRELLATSRIVGTTTAPYGEKYKIQPAVQEDIRQFLKLEHNGIAHLVEMINKDLRDLKIISEGMNQLLGKQ